MEHDRLVLEDCFPLKGDPSGATWYGKNAPGLGGAHAGRSPGRVPAGQDLEALQGESPDPIFGAVCLGCYGITFCQLMN